MALTAKKTTGKSDGSAGKKGSVKRSETKSDTAKKTPAKKASAKKGIAKPAPLDMTPVDAQVLDRLFETVEARRGTDPAVSHSARLLSRGRKKIAQKFGEEAVECLIEAVAGKQSELVSESADVLYHLIVMWVDAGVAPQQVWQELRRREAMSGVAEKASRPGNEGV
ncbi:phosphoribosyl-ATP diphosphatase [Asaia astilbis]|uniref:phosphoribosyl-ATP diphosphatase n=1 Tax=Asaia astilbis TaxID=610244 RepID=UPI0009FC37AB|nr:phosphoribosyl-ATP diphosphatase [Asaia astilbis]